MLIFRKLRQFFARKDILLVIAISFLAGFLLRSGGDRDHIDTDIHFHETTEEKTAEVWTCSMHPQIRQPGPGQCPICGMDLIPVTSEFDDGELSPRELKLSPTAAKLAEIQVAPVKRQYVKKEIRMVGKVDYDETRVGYITTWLPGRIDRLFVDYTGIPVKKGDHLAEIYSPDLYTAQEELIQALKAVEELQDSKLSTARETALRTVESSREKLRLLGLTIEQIQAFEKQGKPTEHVTIYSPMGGIVIHKNAAEGIYVNTGSRIYTIADLSKVWILLDVYESDLEWIRYGQEIEFNTEAYPGETFKGKIAFIDPILNDKTRTVKVRVNVPNTNEKLKPNMFVKAVVYSSVALGGKVMDPSLVGKYIGPMHPEIVKDGPGTCDICGMPLVKAESLGYANPTTDKPPLVIPASAPLITGKRAVVYVSVPEKEGAFEGKEIVLGPRTGDYYLVEEGLREGEMVVVNGNFKIDSAVQILAKPSMMSPEGGVAPAGHHHGGTPAAAPVAASEQERDHTSMEMQPAKEHEKRYESSNTFKKQLDQVFQAYFHIQFALSHDNADNAVEGAKHLQKALTNVDMSLVIGEAHMAWMKELEVINKSGKQIADAEDINASRTTFIHLSHSMINVAKMFGTSGSESTYRFHCPMADNNKGADWLQNKSELENPFYGSSMLKCGELVETLTNNH
ncbi:efflux RND transporter periplasmic adaptor subunit [Candidatus Latescibacterota bacterium]